MEPGVDSIQITADLIKDPSRIRSPVETCPGCFRKILVFVALAYAL